MKFEEARLRERVLLALLRHGRQNEGRLAAKVRRSLFEESWNACVDALLAGGLVSAVLTGYGRSRTLELTAFGAEEAQKTKAQREEQAAKEIQATAK